MKKLFAVLALVTLSLNALLADDVLKENENLFNGPSSDPLQEVDKELGDKKFLEQKKPIQNPAGWLRCALEEQYADAGADLEKVRQEKLAEAEAKNQARKEYYERQLREELEKDHTEVDESNPFYGYFLRHCKQNGDKGTEGNQGHPVET